MVTEKCPLAGPQKEIRSTFKPTDRNLQGSHGRDHGGEDND
jgi:hypothetical protein